MMPNFSNYLTIFEGPDGSGKTTAAREYAEATDALYVHFPALPRVTDGLARMYVEAMMPALLGHQSVVFDRSWLSEIPYGVVFREGADRLGAVKIRMLERLAYRCGAVVVKCQTDWERTKTNYLSRKHLEMLDNESQLAEVYSIYRGMRTDLPMLCYDYQQFDMSDLHSTIYKFRTGLHPLSVRSAGNSDAPVVLIGETFAERKNQDPFYQWPFASFSKDGCSYWLTEQLMHANIHESSLLWVNADQNLGFIQGRNITVITLGEQAKKAAKDFHLTVHASVAHPQYAKRFYHNSNYALTQKILEVLS
jgi:hypothetical protein